MWETQHETKSNIIVYCLVLAFTKSILTTIQFSTHAYITRLLNYIFNLIALHLHTTFNIGKNSVFASASVYYLLRSEFDKEKWLRYGRGIVRSDLIRFHPCFPIHGQVWHVVQHSLLFTPLLLLVHFLFLLSNLFKRLLIIGSTFSKAGLIMLSASIILGLDIFKP